VFEVVQANALHVDELSLRGIGAFGLAGPALDQEGGPCEGQGGQGEWVSPDESRDGCEAASNVHLRHSFAPVCPGLDADRAEWCGWAGRSSPTPFIGEAGRIVTADDDEIQLQDHQREQMIRTVCPKYPQLAMCLESDRTRRLALYDFPAEHWSHLRTNNPIKSTFATVQLRTDKTRGCVSPESILARVFERGKSAARHWRRLNGMPHRAEVIEGVHFQDGVWESIEQITA
jgi:hypothetical protein